ncbi:MAG: peptidoglycan editing factor PgeF [Candidatus Melainabacteria bacterium]|nr:peptidoglycan editing factor PgeF [Candidatus Melainabacteria bacterium]MBI3307880.1 peptidoglycan editing factor PgeF [Candidatus Melainabacteria bacterium]
MLFQKQCEQKAWNEIDYGQVKGWHCLPFLKFSNLKHLFTSKAYDLNLAKHQPTVFPEKSVDKNRQMLCKALGLEYESLIVLPIVHSDNILILESPTQEIGEADAVITHLINIPLLITAADCVPILLYVPEKNIVGLIHAGWRGTVNKIAEKTVVAMLEHYRVRPSQIYAAIGPAIGRKRYEVNEDVAQLLIDATESEEIIDRIGIKPKADLKLANYIQLDNAGVLNIFTSEMDTAVHTTKLYSHRIQGKRAGRQGLIACLVQET